MLGPRAPAQQCVSRENPPAPPPHLGPSRAVGVPAKLFYPKLQKDPDLGGGGRAELFEAATWILKKGVCSPRLLVAIGLAGGSVTSHVSFLLCV